MCYEVSTYQVSKKMSDVQSEKETVAAKKLCNFNNQNFSKHCAMDLKLKDLVLF